MRIHFLFLVLVILIAGRTTDLFDGAVKAAGQTEWDKTIEDARKESKVVAEIPASAELKKASPRVPSHGFQVFNWTKLLPADQQTSAKPARSPRLACAISTY